MTWTGDLSQMDHLVDRLRDLAEVPSRAASKASFMIADLIDQEFTAGEDPYGTPWEPLAQSTVDRGRHDPPLTDTYEMRDSTRVRPMQRSGIAITIDHPAAPHQTGWVGPLSTGPSRPILPMRGELPVAWRDVIRECVVAEFRRA